MSDSKLDLVGAGDGPDTVLLVHSSGMAAGQWLRHIAQLAHRHRVVAPNLLGYGKSPAWDPSHEVADGDDLAALRAVVDDLQGTVHLVGHSYGGTLAARLALALPDRFASLALFEPVLFGLLDPVADAEAFSELALPGLQGMTLGSAEWISAFVDYWGGAGTFAKMSPAIQKSFLQTAPKVAAEVIGIAADQRPPDAYRGLVLPALLAYGEKTTLAGRVMTQRLASVLPNARLEMIPGVGHMAPVVRAGDTCNLLEALFARVTSA